MEEIKIGAYVTLNAMSCAQGGMKGADFERFIDGVVGGSATVDIDKGVKSLNKLGIEIEG